MWVKTYLKTLHFLRDTLFVVFSQISKHNPDVVKNLVTQ